MHCGYFVKSKKRDKLNLEIHDVVVHFWTENNQISPNKRDVIKKRIDIGRWETHAIHFLVES
jgi:hypothetical protein